jgi:hypothetical protein
MIFFLILRDIFHFAKVGTRGKRPGRARGFEPWKKVVARSPIYDWVVFFKQSLKRQMVTCFFELNIPPTSLPFQDFYSSAKNFTNPTSHERKIHAPLASCFLIFQLSGAKLNSGLFNSTTTNIFP